MMLLGDGIFEDAKNLQILYSTPRYSIVKLNQREALIIPSDKYCTTKCIDIISWMQGKNLGKRLSPRFIETCEDFGNYVLKDLKLKNKYLSIVRIGRSTI